MLSEWTTACPDWESRIRTNQSLIPFEPMDRQRAAKAVRIFKRLRMTDVIGQPTMGQACDEWVLEWVAAIFGSYNPVSKRQLIRSFFLLVAKKNGKSSIAAGVMLTALIMNERALGEYMILAPTKEVADNSFIPAYGMVKLDPVLFTRFKPSDTTREITDRLDGSVLAVKAADADVIGGQKSIAVFVDELWLLGKKASAGNILSEATGSLASRPEGFVIYASTQSDDPPAGEFKTKLDYFRAVRDGKRIDKTALPLIYEYPAGMQKAKAWENKRTWHIPNPNLGRSVDPEWLEQTLGEKTYDGPGPLRLFIAKHFNVQVGIGLHADRWAGADYWERQADPTITFDEILRRCECCVVGLDGGGLDDLFGFNLLGRLPGEVEVDDLEEDGKTIVKRSAKQWLSWSHAWCHERVLTERKSIASVLEGFKRDGDLTIVDDKLDDITQITARIKTVKDAGLLYCVSVDPAGIGEMIDALAEIEVTQENKEQQSNFVLGAPQGYAMMNAIKTAERKLVNGTLIHAPQPVMDWAVGNLKIEPTATAIRATKMNAGDAKIDPIMAAFDSVTVMSRNPVITGGGIPQVSVF